MSAIAVAPVKRPVPTVRIAYWAILSLAPMTAYAAPLWQSALADTPTAYLVWVPVLAALWGGIAIASSPPYAQDGELDTMLGMILLFSAGAALVFGPVRWPYFFVMQDGGVLLWPVWMLGMACLTFGAGAMPRLLAPLTYLLLAWPPILGALAQLTQGILLRVSVAVISSLSSRVSWLAGRDATAGAFLVQHGPHWVAVTISSACSGADSAIGAAILVPLLLAGYRGGTWRKALLVALAALGAVALNLLRLSAIIVALHAAGSGFALGVLHPVLGFVLFAVLAMGIAALAERMGLQLHRSVQRPPQAPSRGRVYLSAGLAAALFILLLPLFSLRSGAPGKPVAVASADPSALLAKLPGFTPAARQTFDDQSILGPGATSVSQMYLSLSGATVLAEVWEVPNLGPLASYGFRNCLLFHGEQIQALRTFALGNGTPAVDYSLRLPPTTPGGHWQSYEDVEWESSIRLPGGGIRYLRFAVAALAQPAGSWPNWLRSAPPASPVRGAQALMLPSSFGTWPSSLAPSRDALDAFAQRLVADMGSGALALDTASRP